MATDKDYHGRLPESPYDPLTEYLSQPCDDCDRTATHNAASKIDGRRGKFCNLCMDWDKPACARND